MPVEAVYDGKVLVISGGEVPAVVRVKDGRVVVDREGVPPGHEFGIGPGFRRGHSFEGKPKVETKITSRSWRKVPVREG